MRVSRAFVSTLVLALAMGVGSNCGGGANQDDADREAGGRARVADTGTVHFTVDVRSRFAISPYIYGINGYGAPPDSSTPLWPRGVTLSRFGGNRLTAYNWENNASNAGSDWYFENDDVLGGGDTPGEATRIRVLGAHAHGASIIVTVPMLGYVARDMDHTSVGTDPATFRTRLASRFVRSYASKDAPFAPEPDLDDDAVYQDEFVHWLVQRFPDARGTPGRSPLFLALDNEPDLWSTTHEELLPKVAASETETLRETMQHAPSGGLRAVKAVLRAGRDLIRRPLQPVVQPAQLTYDGFIDRTIEYAGALKRVAPSALIFGPGTGTWAGVQSLGRVRSPDPRYGYRPFVEVYLDRLREAERTAGRRLVDVLDVHWYPELVVDGDRIDDDLAPQTPEMVDARLQAPRSLWDPTYDEHTWVSAARGGHVRLLPFLREQIAAHYPGTKLAISEYFYGRGGDISGGVAQADVLGIFGREGVFAAALWPNANLDAVPYGGNAERAYSYVIGAFRMYRDYDGHGGAFGQTGLQARTSAPTTSSVYASTDDDGLSRVVVVAINKQSRPRPALIDVADTRGWRSAEIYTLTADAPEPQRAPDRSLAGSSAIHYTMPPMSVSTLVLRR